MLLNCEDVLGRRFAVRPLEYRRLLLEGGNPFMVQIDVKGPTMSPVYDFLKSKQPGEIEWNYVKVGAGRLCCGPLVANSMYQVPVSCGAYSP